MHNLPAGVRVQRFKVQRSQNTTTDWSYLLDCKHRAVIHISGQETRTEGTSANEFTLYPMLTLDIGVIASIVNVLHSEKRGRGRGRGGKGEGEGRGRRGEEGGGGGKRSNNYDHKALINQNRNWSYNGIGMRLTRMEPRFCPHLMTLILTAGLDMDQHLWSGRGQTEEGWVWHLVYHHGADLGQSSCLLLFDVVLA